MRKALAALFVAGLAGSAMAIKPFTLIEDGYPERPGQLELENTFVAAWHNPAEHGYQNYSMENELEYGVAENFTLRAKGTYYYEKSKDNTGLNFDAAGLEGQFFFTNPVTDKVGVSLIASFEVGESTLINECFLVIQKDFDKWLIGYNFGLATEIAGVFQSHGEGTETSGAIINSLGVSYLLKDNLKIGLETSLESAYDNWSTYGGTTWYAGPCVNWIPNDKIWITTGLSYQLTDTDDAPKWQFSFIFGYYF